MTGAAGDHAARDAVQLRDLLFGDVPLAAWGPGDAAGATDEPWRGLAAARQALAAGDTGAATGIFRALAGRPGLESRHYVQLWHFLRQLGVEPGGAEAKHVYGVVLEVHLDEGLDTLAAYADHSARYFNHGGGVIIWEADDPAIAAHIDRLLRVGQQVAELIGPWTEARRPAPPPGHARLNMLTPSGLHFGEGTLEVLSADPKGSPLLEAGARLMQALVERAQPSA